jgi:hypothetical protein
MTVPLPPVVIQHAVWLYLRFTLSYRDVEDLLAERAFRKSGTNRRYGAGDEEWQLRRCILSMECRDAQPNDLSNALRHRRMSPIDRWQCNPSSCRPT